MKQEKLELELYRISSNKDSTLGCLYELQGNGKKRYLCFTLEDEYREVKVMAETRIPDGKYEIKLRDFGGYHEKYKKRFEDIHQGMLWLQDVPNFKYILMHCGNTAEDSAGCLLLGYAPKRLKGGDFALYNSTQAYFDIYPPIEKVLSNGGVVTIKIIDFDEVPEWMG
jgi:hypothetical protein